MANQQMETAEHIFERAIKDFKSTLDERKLECFAGVTVEQIKKRVIDIQADQESQRTLMNFNRIHNFLGAWESFDESCKTLQTGLRDLSGLIWGPLDWVLRVAKERPKALDRVLQSYLSLGQRLSPIAQYRTQLAEHVSLRKCLAWMYCDLLIFHKHILKLFEPRDWRTTFETQWKDYNDLGLFNSLLDSCEKNGQCIQRTVSTQVSLDTQRRLNDHVSRHGDVMSEVLDHISLYEEHVAMYEKDRERIFTEARNAETSRKHAQFIAILGWLRSPMESEKRRHEHCQATRSEYQDTGSWLLKEEKITYWIEQEVPTHSMLWLEGGKGAGKTVLASIIIDHLIERRNDVITSYFYCRSGDEKSGEGLYLAVIKSLLRQILSENRDLLATLYERRVNSRNGVEILDDIGTAKSLLELLCDVPVRHFIVIDGIDEMSRVERKAAIQCLASIVQRSDKHSPGRIRVLLVSTDVDDMRAFMKMGDCLDVYELRSSDIQKDIGRYLKKQSHALQSKFRLKDEDVERAIQRILAKSNGMFLYAFLVSDNLLKQPTAGRFLTESKSTHFPKDLKEAYNKILERLRTENEPAWEETKKVFSWLICARRPLKWHELQAVLSMRVDENGALQHSQSDRLCCDIRELCGSLIRVVGNTIEFIHETVETYVIGNENLDRGILETDVALLCLSYISHSCLSNGVDETSMVRYVDEGLYTFQDYAVAKWDSHLTTVVTEYADIFRDGASGQSYHQKALMALQQFILVHGESLPALGGEQIVLQDRAASQCEVVQDLAFYDSLVLVLAHIYRHHEQGTSKRHQVGVGGLKQAIGRTRAAIIAWSQNTLAPEKVEDYYGTNLYKCSRATCAWFYEGFDSEDKLADHNKRHDRPYTCPFEASCSLARFGFPSHRDRDRHVRTYHSEEGGNEGAAGQSQIDNVEEAETARTGAKFRCNTCGNSYTRKAILRAHIDSAHLGKRPFECSVCGRAFTRKNDRSRHERTRHTRR